MPPDASEPTGRWAIAGIDVAVVVEVSSARPRRELPDVSIVISEGCATVRGIVERPEEQEALSRFALSLEGVDVVENCVQLPTA